MIFLAGKDFDVIFDRLQMTVEQLLPDRIILLGAGGNPGLEGNLGIDDDIPPAGKMDNDIRPASLSSLVIE